MQLGKKLPFLLSSFAAFCVPAVALWLRSGYSYGATIFLLGSLLFAHQWLKAAPDRKTQVLGFLFFLMAIAWYQLSALESSAGRWDRPVKYLLGIACLFYAVHFPPQRKVFFWGLVVGCFGAGMTGIWQVYHLGMPRAMGTTNAIQWGNIALLMALLLAVQLGVFWREFGWPLKGVILSAVLLGCEASVLSASRGGWAALLGILPLAGFFLLHFRRDLALKAAVGVVALLATVLVLNFGMLSTRWAAADNDVSHFFEKSEKNTSVGVRLEQYRLALEMIQERPLLGWGMHGYRKEISRRVDDGAYSEAIREFNFIHNEFLDLWVKLGIAGVLLQAALYWFVAWMFWPTRSRMDAFRKGSVEWKDVLALRLSGLVVPVAYAGFGLSQAFFVHNSGIIFFVFPVIILWSAVCGVHRKAGIPLY